MGEHVRAGDVDLWTEQVGQGSDVLLFGGLGDTVESWQFQLEGVADRYRLTAFDNRGAGRTVMPEAGISAGGMADDAAELLRALEVSSAHVGGFSMGSAIAQELALRHPQLVRSLELVSTYARTDALFRSQLHFWRWLPEAAPANAPSSKGPSRGSTRPARTRTDRWTRSSRRPSPSLTSSPSRRSKRRWTSVSRTTRSIACRRSRCPTLVLAGERDMILPPRFGHAVADAIPGAQFETLRDEAHQPFQEIPDEFNARVDAFWRQVEARS